MDGGRASGAPRLLAIDFTSKKLKKVQKSTKKYIMICENIQKYTKIQASVQHGLYLFTCEIHSFNSIDPSRDTSYEQCGKICKNI